mmetsp:Transcript_26534/g.26785  ORF Transcript_26534/g.26785 Transcript_26534/m.26785 type:complete len:316 (+) Transcript_26534:63-1010(+)|eukprot:CAMPEP_0182429502 /NCGR_PEP_ID=MMETSP1167-20130531/29692_1 /TAXON_ID=2988 /ORGANISM="Mallomonas Sp, Strain CCMP3275" /LENGTH=315 /DNA_ID=CAMNT_0024613259 /DNA_START=26 /DNA_END=973 /DNA_ORIENTATION=+
MPEIIIVDEMRKSERKEGPLSRTALSFLTAGLGGCIGWVAIHPLNTLAVRMNLASTSSLSSEKPIFLKYAANTISKNGFLSLYSGLGAGLTRQIFYATARLGLYEALRDEVAKYRETDVWSRLLTGCISGGMAAAISCPAEMTLVRMSNDSTLHELQRRNYTGVGNAFKRILMEEGPMTFFTGIGPFVNRAMVVGCVQVGTYDQFRSTFRSLGIKNELFNVFCASMTSGLIYAIATMPFESAKNRMAFQKVDPITNQKPYNSLFQTVTTIARKEGVLSLWNGFTPYYLRCGGHTVAMFFAVELLRNAYYAQYGKI